MAKTTSTLSELTRTPTPPSNESNYLTASEGTSASASITEPSSPAGDSSEGSAHPKAVYRDAVGLPRELKLRCHIHLEEQYCEHLPFIPLVSSSVRMHAKQHAKTLPPSTY